MYQERKLIKVGETSRFLNTRRQELNTGNPYRLLILAAWKVTDKKRGEKVALSFLDNDPTYERARPTYRGGREWFIVKTGTLRKVYKGIEKNLKDCHLFVKRLYPKRL